MASISAIIPAYNATTRYLDQAIGSALSQTHAPSEVIVVDDASSDDTAGLVARFPRVRYVRRTENGGQAAARNDGAKLATGEFLAFLDQDDLWEPTFLEEALAVLQAMTIIFTPRATSPSMISSANCRTSASERGP